MRFAIDSSKWPIVVVRYPPTVTVEDIDAYMDELVVISKRGPFMVVADLGQLEEGQHTSAPMRKRLVSRIAELAEGGNYLGEAVILDSMVRRGLYTAYTFAAGNRRYLSKAFATVEEGFTWCQETMRHRKTGTAG